MYESGQADSVILYVGLGSEAMERTRRRFRSEHLSGDALAVAYVAFDVTRPPFDDVRVRKAFALATDRRMLAEKVLGGFFEAATGGLVPPGMPGHSPGTALPYNPAMARRLLAEAGYSEGSGLPNPVGVTVAGLAAVVHALSAQWLKDLRVRVDWESSAQAFFFDEQQRAQACAWAGAWSADYPDPDTFLRVAVHEASQWRNETYERLIEFARQITDQERRMRLYRAAERILIQEAALLPLFYGRRHKLVKPWVKNYPGPWKDVIIEPH
jgi:ABC-type oligopeptide transport system substrate-binding subunit